MKRTILGARIRQRRRDLGITQAELARRLDISPSYLNLIEHNKRGIAGALLRKTADALALELSELDGAAERRLLETLGALASSPGMEALGIETDSAGELIGRYPGWARAVAALARSERDTATLASALSDRLAHDPFLREAVHRMLTQVAALRSAAEILVEYPDLAVTQQQQFHQIALEESQRLSEVSEALAAYFDKSDNAGRVLTPVDEVEALFDAHNNHFSTLESAAAALPAVRIADALISPWQKARERVAREMNPAIEAVLSASSQLETARARKEAREALLTYSAAALLAPMPVFADQARSVHYDIEQLSESLGVGVDVVCLRLASLPEGEDTPRFAYFEANAAGTIVTARNVPGLWAPRYGSACPLWVLYRAQQSPSTMLRQRTLFPSGARYVFLARARNMGQTGFGQPRHYRTDMLAISERDASLTVYAPEAGVPVEAVGSACRSCERRDCLHRIADPLAG